MAHRAIRQGDEFYCPVCGARWDASEDAPDKCFPIPPSNMHAQPPKEYADKVAKRKGLITKEQWADISRWAHNGFKDEERPGR